MIAPQRRALSLSTVRRGGGQGVWPATKEATVGMQVGLDAYTVRDMKRDAVGRLDWAGAHGLDGVQFPLATELSRTMDEGEIRDEVAHAARLGFYLDWGLSTI